MKRTLYLLLLCVVGLVFSCSEDDSLKGIPEKEKAGTGYKRSVISFHDMKAKLSGSPGKSLSLFSNIANKGGDDYILEIDSTYIIEYSNDTLTTYTMKVSTLDDELYSFSNLIIKLSNGEAEEYVSHYSPSAAWQAAHDSGEYLPYEGELALVDLNGEDTLPQGKAVYCSFSLEPIYDPDGCSCGGGTVIGYELVVSCRTTSDGSPNGNGGNGGPGDPGNNPPPGGGMPTDPIGGDNGSGMGNSPCDALNAKLLDLNFRQNIQHLNTKVSTTPYEHGFVNHNPNQNPDISSDKTNQYSPTVSVMEQHCKSKADMQIEGAHVFGYMHTHPGTSQCPDAMGVHSDADIKAFLDILRYRHGMNYSLHDTYGIVVGGHGIYALKLEDATKFNNWLLNIDTRAKYRKYFEDMKK